ncbi:MAG: hypothetical protein ACLPH3_12710 [Terracidiphilus sp.]
MRFRFKGWPVEEEDRGNGISRNARTADYSIIEWFDDFGVYHDLILSGSDVAWLSEMNVSIEDRDS